MTPREQLGQCMHLTKVVSWQRASYTSGQESEHSTCMPWERLAIVACLLDSMPQIVLCIIFAGMNELYCWSFKQLLCVKTNQQYVDCTCLQSLSTFEDPVMHNITMMHLQAGSLSWCTCTCIGFLCLRLQDFYSSTNGGCDTFHAPVGRSSTVSGQDAPAA